MGSEAQTTLRIGRKAYAGKALLETTELLFRGEIRLKIALKDVKSVEAKAGVLKVAYPEGTATFELGATAARWADKIQNPKTRIDKLGVKPEHRVVLLNLTDKQLLSDLRERAAAVSNGRLAKDVDAVFVGADSLADLKRLPEIVPYLKRDGAVWTVTPKGKGGIKDTDVMAAAKAAGLVAVKVVSFSDTHSASKFVIPKADR